MLYNFIQISPPPTPPPPPPGLDIDSMLLILICLAIIYGIKIINNKHYKEKKIDYRG